jgi:hypothetical protein
VRCFADPDAHQHEARDPSTSINLEHGAWHCHGCGARGGAYDAALALGHDPRSAIELMIRHGLTERRGTTRRRRPHRRPGARRISTGRTAPVATTIRDKAERRPPVSESDLQRWHLLGRVDLLHRLALTRGWRGETVRRLQLGLDDDQVTIPVRDEHRDLVALLRYQPDRQPGQPKIRAAYRSRRALFPHPAAEASRELLLVEGEPDAIAARSRELPAIAIPGVDGWQPEWSTLFAGRVVTIALDADLQGRACARQVANDLAGHAAVVELVDLAPGRSDGYDLTDWLLAHPADAQQTCEQLHRLQTRRAA